MECSGVHHVSINVTDAAVAARFYIDVLGMTERSDRPDFPFRGSWLQVGAQQVHLLEVEGFIPPEGQHFAIHVDDIEAAREELATHGVALSDTIEIAGVCRQAFLKDPTGNLIELNEPR
ncbi:MAG: lactoylglutathione lyase [Ilumatobacter sp.]|nr:lactoylglutathione lyase [Ilumatobacter sp.]